MVGPQQSLGSVIGASPSPVTADQLHEVKAAADFLLLEEPVRLALWVQAGLSPDDLVCSSGAAVPQLYYAAILKDLLGLDEVQFGADVALKLAKKLGGLKQIRSASDEAFPAAWGGDICLQGI
eukprot:SAG31_NODE_17838_length_656_cov_0.935368_1_plen_123_part_00